MNRSGGGSGTAGPTPTKTNEAAKNVQVSPSTGTVSTALQANPVVATNESIKLIAESIGVTNLNEEATRELASDLTFIVKSIIADAQKFARRSRRKRIVPSDIDYSLKARSIEPIYGFASTDQVPFRCATSTGGNGSGRSIFYPEDHIIDLIDLITVNNQAVKIPNDFAIHAHWLAIEGVQPSVPENPQLVTREMQKLEAVDGLVGNKSKDQAQKQLHNQQKRGENMVKLKSLMPHDLSVEQQIYFKEVTEACVGSDEQKRTEGLNSLSTDPGLHQLLSRLILFISEGVRLNILQQNMGILIYLMRMAKSLSENKSIYLEKYLHELLPSVLSCVLSKQVCARPEVENHCALREFCARLIGQIVKTYSPTIPTLQTRIIKIYLNSLQSDQTTFATLFGAISGLTELGSEICESFIFPLVKMVGERVTQILDSQASQQEKLPAEKVKQQLIRSISSILKTRFIENEYDYLIGEFGAYFGPIIHTQLMKLRSTQQNAAQAHALANANQQRTVIMPQTNCSAPNQARSSNNPATLNTNISTKTYPNLPNQLNGIEVTSNTHTTNQSTTYQSQFTTNSPTKTRVVNISSTSTYPGDSSTNPLLTSNSDTRGDFVSRTITSSTTTCNQNNSQFVNMRIENVSSDFVKTDSIVMSVDQNDDMMGSIKSEMVPVTGEGAYVENNQNNLSSMTSDSNNTNNMTTSDVNLSDNNGELNGETLDQ